MKKLLTNILMFILLTLGWYRLGELAIDYYLSEPRQLHYSLNGEIEPNKARAVSSWLMSLNKGDKALLHIETYGGHVVSAYKIMEYIKRSKGDVTCYVDSHAMSAGAVILSSCKKILVTPNAQVLFHLPRYNGVNGLTLANSDQASYILLMKTMENCKFVTKSDITNVQLGKDVTILGSEVMKRLRNK